MKGTGEQQQIKVKQQNFDWSILNVRVAAGEWSVFRLAIFPILLYQRDCFAC